MAKLYFYYSSMNAGKTTTLLQASHNYHERGMETLIFTPIIDTRHAPDKVVSRIGIESQAVPFNEDFDFVDYIVSHKKFKNNTLHCILVDECQFLSKTQVYQLCKISDEHHTPVLCYGLRTNFLGEPFIGSQYLLAWADELIEIKGICHCGKKATMTLRLDNNGHVISHGHEVVIGGNERYVAVCRHHFTESLSQSIEETPNLQKLVS